MNSIHSNRTARLTALVLVGSAATVLAAGSLTGGGASASVGVAPSLVPGLGNSQASGHDARVIEQGATALGRAKDGNLTPAAESERLINLPARTSPIGGVIPPRSSMKAFLDASLDDVHRAWVRGFAASGRPAPQVNYYWPAPGERFQTACTGGPSDDTSLFYCPVDDTIVISQSAAFELWEGRRSGFTIQGTGDMSVSLFVAHEYGHNVVMELGYQPSESNGERAADCLAGVWAADASQRGILEEGDVMKAWQSLDLLAEHPGHTDGGVHGTPAQRQTAFSTGWHHGTSGCISAFLS